MMDIREKLVELLRYADDLCFDTGCMACSHMKRGFHCKAHFYADILIANGVTVQEWIPVTERLPKNDYEKPWWERQRYLVRLQGGSMRVATYGYKEADWWIDSHDCVLHVRHHTAVTHWMLAPTLPKGE